MVQGTDGYLNDHIAATFHAVHYYRLINEPVPMAAQIVARTLREQVGWQLAAQYAVTGSACDIRCGVQFAPAGS